MAKWFSQALVAALCVYGALILFCLIRALRGPDMADRVIAINMIGTRPELSGRGVTMAVMVETYAVLALLSSFLMVFFVQI